MPACAPVEFMHTLTASEVNASPLLANVWCEPWAGCFSQVLERSGP